MGKTTICLPGGGKLILDIDTTQHSVTNVISWGLTSTITKRGNCTTVVIGLEGVTNA